MIDRKGIDVVGSDATVGYKDYDPTAWRKHKVVDAPEGEVPADVLMVLGLSNDDIEDM